jgi:ankyrin repeat protein
LHLASERGLAGTVAKLLSLGADAALKDSYGNTALMVACANGHEAAAAEVMEATKLAGALDHAPPSGVLWGVSALHLASERGLAGTVAKLLSLGADAALKDCEGSTALMAACAEGPGRYTLSAFPDKRPVDLSRRGEVKAVLLEHFEHCVITDDNKNTLLLECARCGLASRLSAVLQAGASAAHKDSRGNTALMVACANGHEAAAAEVMEATKLAGALDVQDRWRRRSALHMASERGLAGTVAKLLSLGADAELKNSRVNTALMLT